MYVTTYQLITNIYKKDVEIDNCKAIAYIDTGSKVNIINSNIVNKLRLTINSLSSNVILRGFGGYNVFSRRYTCD